MKKLIGITAIYSVITTYAFAQQGGGTSANVAPTAFNASSSELKMLPFESYEEIAGLPPSIQITYKLECYQSFAKVVRHDFTNRRTGKVTIALGVLVHSSPFLPCDSSQEVTADAGPAYSGRAYEVTPISK